MPLSGDFNQDTHADAFFYQAGSGVERLWFGDGTKPVEQVNVPSVSGNYTPVAGDFNGDTATDILWYTPGSSPVWLGSLTGLHSGPDVVVHGLYKPFVGDFNGDGHADVFWFAPGSNTSSIWYGT